MKHVKTVAIKLLIDKLNTEVLQIYNKDTKERGPAAVTNNKEDLVIEASLTMQGMVYSFVGW